jgi:hypothetical protein
MRTVQTVHTAMQQNTFHLHLIQNIIVLSFLNWHVSNLKPRHR